MKLAPLVLAALVLVPSAARADDAPTYKDPNTAIMLSGFGYAASVGLTIGGAVALANDNGDETFGTALVLAGGASSIVTPSLGHWYAGDILTPGLGLRVVGAGLATFAIFSDGDDASIGLMLLGGALASGGTIYDLVTAGRAAHAYNAKHNLTLMPTVVRTASGSAPAFGLGGRF